MRSPYVKYVYILLAMYVRYVLFIFPVQVLAES